MTFQGAQGFGQSADAPKFGINARRGFRGWAVPNLVTGHLQSTNWPYDWTVGVNSSTHQASKWPNMFGNPTPKACDFPTVECSCGFYAYHGEDYWWDSGYPSTKGPMIAGVVEGFGRMVIASKGFRAGKAVILALAAPVEVSQGWLDGNRITYEELQSRVLEAVQRRYWNVPIYDTVPELLAAHPLMEAPDAA